MKPETRKVQLTGGSTFIISLPKEWAKGHGLIQGDALGLWPQEDGSIVVTPQPTMKREEPNLVLSVDDVPPDHLFRELISAYQAGFTLVELRTRGRMPPEMRGVAREFARRAIGPEIVEETEESVIIQDLLNPSDLPLRRSFRRMFLIASSMCRDAMLALVDGDVSLAEDVIDRDDEVDRIYWLIAKQYYQILRDVRVAAQVGVTPNQALGYRSCGKHVERIADHGVRIARNIATIAEGDVSPATLRKIDTFGVTAIKMFERAIDSLEAADGSQANETIDEMGALEAHRNRIITSIAKTSGPAGVSLAYVVDSIERIGSYSTDIAEIAMNHAALANEALISRP